MSISSLSLQQHYDNSDDIIDLPDAFGRLYVLRNALEYDSYDFDGCRNYVNEICRVINYIRVNHIPILARQNEDISFVVDVIKWMRRISFTLYRSTGNLQLFAELVRPLTYLEFHLSHEIGQLLLAGFHALGPSMEREFIAHFLIRLYS